MKIAPAIILVLSAGAACAQTTQVTPLATPPSTAATPANPAAPAAPETPATAADRAAMLRMHMRMDIPYTGDADRDFVAGMLPHHQGAVDMARIELQYGHDPELLRLAREIVASQEKEIAFMRRWQIRHLPKHAG